MSKEIVGGPKKRCADCRFWDYNKTNFGYCRKHAPKPTIVPKSEEYILVIPSMGRDDYCWEFESVRDLEIL